MINTTKIKKAAYVCYLFVGAVFTYTALCLLLAMRNYNIGNDLAEITTYIMLPFIIPVLVAMAVGIGLTLFYWRDWKLVTMSLFTVAFYFIMFHLNSVLFVALMSLYALTSFALFIPEFWHKGTSGTERWHHE